MFSVPALPYRYDAFEGIISRDIMELHHDKHHQGYVDKLNAVLADYPEAMNRSVADLVENYKFLPSEIQNPVRNFAGGHYNHSLFWSYLSPVSADAPTGLLMDDIIETFGSFDEFKAKFSASAISLFGSGWTWLMDDMTIVNTSTQDNPITGSAAKPDLCIDVWEHAYYYDYTYRRADYVQEFWKIVNWDGVSANYKQ